MQKLLILSILFFGIYCLSSDLNIAKKAQIFAPTFYTNQATNTAQYICGAAQVKNKKDIADYLINELRLNPAQCLRYFQATELDIFDANNQYDCFNLIFMAYYHNIGPDFAKFLMQLSDSRR